MQITIYNKNTKNKQTFLFREKQDLLDILSENQLNAPEEALSAFVNQKQIDFTYLPQDGDFIELVNFDDERGKEVFWHTSAHILAQAVLRLWPEAKPTIGPPIEHGFYYDFANLQITDKDLKRIEKEMVSIIKENHRPERIEYLSKEDALKDFQDNPYKVEIIESLDPLGSFSAYRQGDFFDLCRGPHLSKLGKVKAVKLLKTSGAYWRGDSKREMLTRIYGITFPSKQQLQAYLEFLKEAQERDHKLIGPKLDLFRFHEQAPGIPFFHPKGLALFDKLLSFWRKLHKEHGYEEIKTPQLLTRNLWETSGHWDYYKENMFCTEVEKRDFAIKPMNCPGCMLYFKSKHFSYRDFPLRIGEIGCVHRYEPSGSLSGLFRVRCFHQDDAHLFLLPEQIADEVCGVLKLIEKIYSTFGLSWHLELSTRPEEKTIGSDEQWALATDGLQRALEQYGQDYRINAGDGAFYGPKIDVHIQDAIGRSWQCATIQLDMALPERFDLEYTDSDGSRKRPIMLHRAIFGSIERFIGILIEHFKGRFPLWLSPSPLRLLPIADRHVDRAKEVQNTLKAHGFDAPIDDSHESMAKKVRAAQLDQVNYMLVLGDEELEKGTLSLRTRENKTEPNVELDIFIQKICKERDDFSLFSEFK